MFEKSLHSMTKKLLSMLVFVCFFAANMSAQEARTTAPVRQPKPIKQLSEFVASLRANTTQRSANSEATRVMSLAKDPQPSVYFQSGEVKLHGDKPVRLYTNVKAVSSISSRAAGLPKDDIEIVTIKVGSSQELAQGIDLSAFSDFPNLKYIYIQAEGNTSAESIVNAVKNNNPRYSVFYEILKYE